MDRRWDYLRLPNPDRKVYATPRRILLSEQHFWDAALDHREMTEDPKRMTAAIPCRKGSGRVANFVDRAQHGSIRNRQRKLNRFSRLHRFSFGKLHFHSVLRLRSEQRYVTLLASVVQGSTMTEVVAGSTQGQWA